MPAPVALADLVALIAPIPLDRSILVRGLALDSRRVEKGDLFLACQGTQRHGKDFITEALARGAAGILLEADTDAPTLEWVQQGGGQVPILALPGLKSELSLIAAHYYGYPACDLRIMGVTGTNGKTSCSHFLAQALRHLGFPCGVLGTLGNGLYGALEPSALTTPDPIQLQRLFHTLVEQKVNYVAMEVSSHSLDQGRVNAVPFELGLFTNLTRDHLDYHHTMEAYAAAKEKLFHFPSLKAAVVNADDAFGEALLANMPLPEATVAYSLHPTAAVKAPLVYAEAVELHDTGIKAHIHSPWGEGSVEAALMGAFNVSNVLAVLSALCLLDIPFAAALDALHHLQPIPGRMQLAGGGRVPLIVVDYAHTPDALAKALQAVRRHCRGTLYCIFGCGGERDRGKRPLMAAIAEQQADKIIITDDNPRHEAPAQIVADIRQGFTHPESVTIEHNRSQAIRDVIHYARAGDVILIAGKGAELYQEIGEQKNPFSDMDEVLTGLSLLKDGDKVR